MNGYDPIYTQILANRPTPYSEPRLPMSRKQKINTFLDNLMFGIGTAYSAASQAPEGSKGLAGFGAGLLAPIQARRDRIAEAQELDRIQSERQQRKLYAAETARAEQELELAPRRVATAEQQAATQAERAQTTMVPMPDGTMQKIYVTDIPAYLTEMRLQEKMDYETTPVEYTIGEGDKQRTIKITPKQAQDYVMKLLEADIDLTTAKGKHELEKALATHRAKVQGEQARETAKQKVDLEKPEKEAQRAHEVEQQRSRALASVNAAILRQEGTSEVDMVKSLPWEGMPVDKRRKFGNNRKMDVDTATQYMRAAADSLVSMPQFQGMTMDQIITAVRAIAQLWAMEDEWDTTPEEK